MKRKLTACGESFRNYLSLSLSLILPAISSFAASGFNHMDGRISHQLSNKSIEENCIPLSEEGAMATIALPGTFGMETGLSNYFQMGNHPGFDLGIPAVNTEPDTLANCLCNLPGGTVNVINAGLGTLYSTLSLPNTINLTDKCLNISGVLLIDVDLSITGGSIRLAGLGTQIVVQSGNSLTLIDVNQDGGMHTCETMWSGILVEDDAALTMDSSLIQDARYAVTLMSGSTHRIQDSDFRRNYVGVYVPPGQSLPVVINQAAVFSGNDFTCDIGSACPFRWDFLDGTGYVKYDKPYAGIEVHNATFVVGSPAAGGSPNTFSLMENGIIGAGANLAVYDAEMEEIDETPQAVNAMPIKGFGIHADTSLIRVERGTFDDVTCGIGLIRPLLNSYIAENAFTDNYSGINVLYGNILIHDNDFTAYEARAVNLDGTSGRVWENTFTAPTAYTVTPSGGVSWSNNPGYTFPGSAFAGRVEDNVFNLGIYGMGVHISNSSAFRIQDNVLNYNAGYTPTPASGIMLSSTSAIQVKYNQVNGIPFGAVSAFGIRTLQSTSNVYCCNEMDYLRGAMGFSGACNNSTIKFNEFGNTVQAGFLCGPSTLIGAQTDYQNEWTGTFSSPPPGVAHAVHNGTSLFISSSNFFINTCSAPLFPPTILPAQSCPGMSGDWFETSSNPSTSECAIDYDCAYSEDDGEESLAVNENDLRFLQGYYDEEEQAAMVNWQMGKDLYQKLLREPALIAYNEDVEDFYNAMPYTALGQLVQINEEVISAKAVPGYMTASWESLTNSIDSLLNELGVIDEELAGEPSPEDIDLLTGQRTVVLAEINGYNEALSGSTASFNSGVRSQLSSLSALNSGINAISAIEVMEKAVNELYLRTLSDASYVLNQGELEDLFEIASLCHLDYGSVVFTARALYQKMVHYHFDDDELCSEEVELKKDGEEETKIVNSARTISIMPNPASDHLDIYWTRESTVEEEMTFELMDMQGKVLLTRKESARDGNIRINISNCTSGLYVLKGMNWTGVQFIEKVIINK